MKVWYMGDLIDIEIGQRVTVCRSGSGHSLFGEPATLKRATKNHLVFITDSGATVKTKIDNLHFVIGKAAKEGFGISMRDYKSFKNISLERVSFWNPETCTFEKK